MKKKVLRAEAALIITTLIWGGTFAMIKSALGYLSPMVFVAMRFSLAALLLLPFAFRTLRESQPFLKQAAVLGLIYFTGFVTQTLGLQYTTATKSAFITGTFVIFTPIFQTIMEKRFPSLINIIAIVLAVVGIILLAGKGNSFFEAVTQISGSFNFGDFLTLICAISYAIYIVYLDMLSAEIDYRFLAFAQIALTAVLGSVIVAILYSSNPDSVQLTINDMVVKAVLYTGVFATIITTILQTKFQKEVTPTRASIIFSMEPIFAAVFAFIILNERMTIIGIIGSLFILSGVLLSELLSNE